MKKLLALTCLLFLAASHAQAQQNLTLTTYYPAPYGAYDQTRLVPRSTAPTCSTSTEGLVYYNDVSNRFEFCQNGGSWTPFNVWTQNSSGQVFLTDTTTPETKKVGIGLSAPLFKLHLQNHGGILAEGAYNDLSGDALTTAGAGTRFIWYPMKAAIRAGEVTGTTWDNTNIGNHSVGFGLNSRAYGAYTVVAGGNNNNADGALATISGGQNNTAGQNSPLTTGSTISGGSNNTALATYATIGGGSYNVASGQLSTVGGGGGAAASEQCPNRAVGIYSTVAGGTCGQANGANSFVGSGLSNLTAAAAQYAVAVGGRENHANAASSAILGGRSNIADGDASSIGGGWNNHTSGTYATIGGGGGMGVVTDGNTASGLNSTIGGGRSNQATGDYSFIGGGGGVNGASHGNTAAGLGSTIGGGRTNQASGDYSTISGGRNGTSAGYATIGGGEGHAASGDHSTIAGGETNIASNFNSTVGGGASNTASGNGAVISGGTNNTAGGQLATVAGGGTNTASAYAATVGGGYNNVAVDTETTIAGGLNNTANGLISTISGGTQHTTFGDYSTISGGWQNTAGTAGLQSYSTVGGGRLNDATGNHSTVSGGYNNDAAGAAATISGGANNIAAGDYSFSAGQFMQLSATADRTYVFGNAVTPYSITQADAFLIFPNSGGIGSTGSVGIGTPTPTAKLHVNGNIKIKMQVVSSSAPITFKWGTGMQPDEVGYDVAELFETSEEVEVGDVLVIDPDQDVKLKRSAVPYDQTVAGIVSSAPAVLFEGQEMQMAPEPYKFQRGTKAPLTLAGRVPCKVSLENGPIKRGDLLTTSATPGHAMKATDPAKITGAIVGKALQPFSGGPDEEKTGVIMVIISLQ